MEIEVTRKGVTFTFPGKQTTKRQNIGRQAVEMAKLNLKHIMIACAKDAKQWAWNEAMKQIPLVTVEKLEFDFRAKTFALKFQAAEKITFGKDDMFR